jgi:hypothetical protein
MDRARRTARELDLSGPDGEQVIHEFQLAGLRNPERLSGAHNQPELMRASAELIVKSVEKVQRDRELGDAYATEAEERSADERAFTRAATRAAARRWRE